MPPIQPRGSPSGSRSPVAAAAAAALEARLQVLRAAPPAAAPLHALGPLAWLDGMRGRHPVELEELAGADFVDW